MSSSYFLIKNEDIEQIKQKNNLPNNDQISDDVLKDVNYKTKYRQSGYNKNGVIVESGATNNGSSILYEAGYYYLIGSAAGGKNKIINRFNGRWIIKKDVNIIDYIKIYNQDGIKTIGYSWERVKVLDETRTDLIGSNNIFSILNKNKDELDILYKNGYINTWKGTYSYLNNTVFLSLLEHNSLPEKRDDYGILMLKNDIFDNKTPKLFSYRLDDSNEETYKYEKLSSTDISSLTDITFNAPDSKGGDGEFFNEVINLENKNTELKYQIGSAPTNYLTNGGNSVIKMDTKNITLLGGNKDKNVNFGGLGGNFLYDYYGRIKYNPKTPEDGYLKILYLGRPNNLAYKLNVIPNEHITNFSHPINHIVQGTPVVLKIELEDDYEIDLENSTINNQSLLDYEEYLLITTTEAEKLTKMELTDCYNNIQTLYFVMPNNWRWVNDERKIVNKDDDVIINLVTKDIKYTVKVDVDDYIKKWNIDGKTEDISFKSGEMVNLNIFYSTKDRKIDEDIFIYYLCFDNENEEEKVTFKPLNILENLQEIEFKMPARNVILKVVTCNKYYLIFQKNERQEFERNEMSINSNRYIKSIIVQNRTENIGMQQSISIFPYTLETKAEIIYDVYVEFSDIYMHLDNTNLYNEIPTINVSKAGDFNDEYIIGSHLLYLKPNIISNSNQELYQHFRFKMPKKNLIINLKWIERLYQIEYNILEKNLISTSIIDSNIYYGITNNGDLTEIRRPQFPHNTYSKIIKNNIVQPNNINISSIPVKDYLLFDKEKSFYRIGEYLSSRVYFKNAPVDSPVKNNQNFDFQITMPKDNLYLYIEMMLGAGAPIITEYKKNVYSSNGVWDYSEKKFYITSGTYEIWCGGAAGGRGGGMTGGEKPSLAALQSGSWGCGGHIKITLTQDTVVSCFIGEEGYVGIPSKDTEINKLFGNVLAGGGGGGNTVLNFSNNFIIKEISEQESIIGSSHNTIACKGGSGASFPSIGGFSGGAGGSGGLFIPNATLNYSPPNNGCGANGGDLYFTERGNITFSGGAGGCGTYGKMFSNSSCVYFQTQRCPELDDPKITEHLPEAISTLDGFILMMKC